MGTPTDNGVANISLVGLSLAAGQKFDWIPNDKLQTTKNMIVCEKTLIGYALSSRSTKLVTKSMIV